MQGNFGKKNWDKWESSLTTVWLKQDPPVISFPLELSLTLTGTNPLLIHLKVNILWYL